MRRIGDAEHLELLVLHLHKDTLHVVDPLRLFREAADLYVDLAHALGVGFKHEIDFFGVAVGVDTKILTRHNATIDGYAERCFLSCAVHRPYGHPKGEGSTQRHLFVIMQVFHRQVGVG